MAIQSIRPPLEKYHKTIAKRQKDKPKCICPGCNRPAAMFSPHQWGELARLAWCSTTCHERWKQLQPKEPKK